MTGYAENESGWSFLLKTISQFQYPASFLLLIPIALLLIAVFGKRRGRMLFVYPTLLLAVLLYNPYVTEWVLNTKQTWITEYYRILYLLPTGILVGYAAITLSSAMKKRIVAVLILAFSCGIVVLAGNFKQVHLPDQALTSVWGADRELVNLVAAMQEDRLTESVLVGTQTQEAAVFVRAYDNDLRAKVISDLNEDDISYYLLKADSRLSQKAQSEKMEVLAKSEHYILYTA